MHGLGKMESIGDVSMSQTYHLLPHFPNLLQGSFEVTSPRSDSYNCVAWAAGDTGRWWWPDEDGFWPGGVSRMYTLDSFKEAFETLGFEVCDSGDFEDGCGKIAIYTTDEGPTHVAKQIAGGDWSSKLGPFEDIRHSDASGVECKLYGRVTIFMKLPVARN